MRIKTIKLIKIKTKIQLQGNTKNIIPEKDHLKKMVYRPC
ncbi:hypothetical protein HMPREF1565_3701 [Providencia alcalifaciens RIMD 1656011]|nr:hypothetical protein HMPREF1562_4091 [Providencia alcalifaciens F90-2004]EUC96088.1 hypothetical protein HMPREF1567_0076 [Providencia alcalifaciens PAL-2]EUD03590.1 hypothetical protein HMPREF1565_3701 [Providencia alcalifaciens RIMD 1656011]EUD06644.1 hypothetical protein HMPREF1564_2977 [Providencia alcalifaciens R90-1475]